MGVQKEVSPFLLLSVLLVAPSASLAGPVPSPTVSPSAVPNEAAAAPNVAAAPPTPNVAAQHPVVIPWGQGVAVGGGQLPLGGFIYCAGCSPLNPAQLVLPSNVPWNKALSASGVLPPQVAKGVQDGSYRIEQQLNGLGGGVAEEPGKAQQIWDDGGVPVQQMALHDDGRYSFSYNTAHASRQEERNLDGNVSGSYSYTDPEGKLVQIDYTAGPMGYQAYGDNVPPQPVVQLPQPVQDTLEVQMARQQFLDTYNRELERIQRDQEAAAAKAATSTVAPEGVVSSSTPSSSEDTEGSTAAPEVNSDDNDAGESQDDAVEVSGKTENEGGSGEVAAQPAAAESLTDEETDSVVINAKGSEEKEDDDGQTPVRSNLPSPAYQITIPIGVGGNAGLSVQQGARGQEETGNNNIGQGQQQQAQAVPVQQINRSNLQPYFYYVSVGGQPHYVTSSVQQGQISPYPTSLKATLLGAQPLAAVHDAQVPNRNNAQGQQNSAIRPIFLDLENGLKLEQQQQQPQQQQQQQQSVPTIINPASLFTLNNNQNLGQLIPLGLTHGGATFGYIPTLILNNNGAQSSQGSQSPVNNNVPLHQQQQQQQQQVSAVPSFNNQPVIVLASKK